MLRIKGTGLRHERIIPLNRDLLKEISDYWHLEQFPLTENGYLFPTDTGAAISQSTLRHTFRRLCRISGVAQSPSSRRIPRLQDLRQTFAVHRITSWVRSDADLNQMLPALAAYMGHTGLGNAESYVDLAPERFRKHLNKLSPGRGKRHWRNDRQLIERLARI
jgi:site-specific recombinase XerD